MELGTLSLHFSEWNNFHTFVWVSIPNDFSLFFRVFIFFTCVDPDEMLGSSFVPLDNKNLQVEIKENHRGKFLKISEVAEVVHLWEFNFLFRWTPALE